MSEVRVRNFQHRNFFTNLFPTLFPLQENIMELLISILMWLGLITAGNTYTVQDIQQIEAANRAVIASKQSEFTQTSNATVKTPPSQMDLVIIGLH
jgi:hypothetical protein